jgi:protein-disulfide isomerase
MQSSENNKVARVLSAAVTSILVGCAIILTAITVNREIKAARSSPSRPAQKVEKWKELLDGGTFLGEPDSKVIAVLFSDYQCRYCR